MEFTFSPEADDAAALAAAILGDHTGQERLKAVETSGDRFDRDLWKLLSDAFGDWTEVSLIELCRVLVEVGRTVAPLPLAVHGPAALLLTENGIDPSGRLITAAVA